MQLGHPHTVMTFEMRQIQWGILIIQVQAGILKFHRYLLCACHLWFILELISARLFCRSLCLCTHFIPYISVILCFSTFICNTWIIYGTLSRAPTCFLCSLRKDIHLAHISHKHQDTLSMCSSYVYKSKPKANVWDCAYYNWFYYISISNCIIAWLYVTGLAAFSLVY